jgi:hypothetical protein
MSEQANEKRTSDPHGGISASGETADELQPDSGEINDYGNTGQEVVTNSDQES